MIPDAGPAPAHPTLRAGEVHIWQLEVGHGEATNQDVPHLSRQERNRATQLRVAADRAAFEQARGFLRQTLSRYLRMDPAAVPLVTGRWGRPQLDPTGLSSTADGRPNPSPHPLPHFNLAHGRGIVLLAVSDLPVGIDVEPRDPLPDLEEVIQGALTEQERVSLPEPGASGRLDSFLRIWTRKEAFLKGIGIGLTVDPRDVCVADPDRPELRVAVPGLEAAAMTGWHTLTLSFGRDALGALAVHGSVAGVHRFRDGVCVTHPGSP